jgi:Fe-Mn family superoxide dismutase
LEVSIAKFNLNPIQITLSINPFSFLYVLVLQKINKQLFTLNLKIMIHKLPKLPYAKDALEPYISAKTLDFHYGKHHQAYVNNLNNLISGTEFENASLEEIVLKSGGGIFNNAAQIWNHTFYFNQFCKKGCDEPKDVLIKAINAKFGSFESFTEQFSKAAATLFGSGWAWLVVSENGELEIVQTSNAANPMTDDKKPILTCDVWEHAYYIDKKNARPKYIEDFWKILDWKVISVRYSDIK